MKIIVPILFCFLLCSSCQSSGIGSLIKITEPETKYEVWDPGILNRVAFEKALKRYLLTAATEDPIYADLKYILKNLSNYTIEYSGIVMDGKKIIYCQMILDFDEMYPEYVGISEASEFSTIFDGGCDIVDVWYDPEDGEVTELWCNGVA
jgi:hypothetical protein